MVRMVLNWASKTRVLREWVGKPLLHTNEVIWNRLPPSITTTRPARRYGVLMHSLVEAGSERRQAHRTFFFRNRPEMDLIRALANQRARGSTIRVAVLACSNGAEVYSILWTIRSARPDLNVVVQAIDTSAEILEIARNGVYSLDARDLADAPIFERMTDEEMQALFDIEGDRATVKSSIKEGVCWRVADAGDPRLPEILGLQDIVVANRFLCHMAPRDAEDCLRKIVCLVDPEGYLFVSGVNLDVRTKVARDLGWVPVQDLLEEVHNGDPFMTRGWPWKYWGLEPFSNEREDWRLRYASAYKPVRVM